MAARQSIGDLKTDRTDGVVDPLITQAIRLNDALIESTRKRVELESSLRDGAVGH